MKTKKSMMTQEGLNELIKELEYRKTEKHEELKDMREKMREAGDISENEGLEIAIEESLANEKRISELEKIIENAEVVKSDGKSTVVDIGSTVKVESTSEQTFKIVGENEANPLEGKISHESPLGKALLKKSKGDTAKLETPQGEVEYKILDVS